MAAEVEAKCVGCKHKWWVGEGEVHPNDMPQCPKCLDFGVATGKARATPEDRP